MSLPVPVVGVDPAPDFANNINSSLTILDQHNHAPGSGVQINPAGLNINANLSMQANNLTSIGALTFTPSSLPANGSLYESLVDLYYVDGNGNNIRITSGGTVNATSSGISSGTATASFVGGVLVVNSNTNTPANIQGASLLLGNNVANSKYITLSPPNALGSNYSLVLPSIPAQTNVMTLDTSGNMASVTYDQVGENMTSVGANAIQAATTRTVGNVVGTGGVALSSDSGVYASNATSNTPVTNLGLSLVTSGRPVMIIIQPSNNSAFSSFMELNGPSPTATFLIARNSSNISASMLLSIAPDEQIPQFISFIDFPSAGTNVYNLGAFVNSSSVTLTISHYTMIAYEL